MVAASGGLNKAFVLIDTVNHRVVAAADCGNKDFVIQSVRYCHMISCADDSCVPACSVMQIHNFMGLTALVSMWFINSRLTIGLGPETTGQEFG